MDCDVLITHTPPHGMLDTSRSRKGLGCPFLLDRVSKVSPKYHLFGHIHNSRGKTEFNGTTFVNATSVNSQYELVHMPFEVKL